MADSGELADCIEWRTVEIDDRQLVIITNYSHDKRTFEIEVDGEKPTKLGELIGSRIIDGNQITVGGLRPKLIEIGGSSKIRTEPRGPVTPTPTMSPTPSDELTGTASDTQTPIESTLSEASSETTTEGPGLGAATTIVAAITAARLWIRRLDDES
jgi:Predicted solute binding protein